MKLKKVSGTGLIHSFAFVGEKKNKKLKANLFFLSGTMHNFIISEDSSNIEYSESALCYLCVANEEHTSVGLEPMQDFEIHVRHTVACKNLFLQICIYKKLRPPMTTGKIAMLIISHDLHLFFK